MTALTELLQKSREGDVVSREQVFAVAYSELRRLAHARLRDGGRNTVLDTTALVHESYLKFVGAGELRADDRRAFFAYASSVMRSVIIDAVRERQAQRRGGQAQHVTLSTQLLDAAEPGGEDVLRVHEALEVLAQAEPRLAQVVEMRYFGGYSEAEIAEALELTERTVQRDWNKARMLLGALLSD